MEFLTDYLRMMVGGNLNAFEIENLMDNEIETHHHEGEVPIQAVAKLADGLPAFGIVAAVMGVVHTMESVGHAAGRTGQADRRCAGRHLPRHPAGLRLRRSAATLLEQKLHESTKMFQCMKVTLLASLNGYAPQVAVEFGRKVLYSTERPASSELEDEVKSRRASERRPA
jgi:chemotaxis protein MotA